MFKTLPTALRYLRIEQRLTQRQLGQLTGISLPVISAFERGAVIPRLPVLELLLFALQVPDLKSLACVLELVEGQEEAIRRRRYVRTRTHPPIDVAEDAACLQHFLGSLGTSTARSREEPPR